MTSCEYSCSPSGFVFDEGMKKDFLESGYIMIRNLLDEEEVSKIRQSLETSEDLQKNAFGVADENGKASKLVIWKHPGNDVTGMLGRCEKVVSTCEKLLGGEVYHYHTKLMMKEPLSGGSFIWHQDYGYWYHNGFLTPDMMTVFIAVDKCIKENGCLEVIRGSHKCGRIEHKKVGGQTGADIERVELIKKKFPLEHVEMNPGDALFFHSNLLHASNANNSDLRRWTLLSCYCKASNDTVTPHCLPSYTPLRKVPDSAIRECTSLDCSGKEFMDPEKDVNIKSTPGDKDKSS
ncbi:Hypothetical predicted protein [Mytilus galloprovincialis]|uniref:Ectoine hydroxylase n=1 Tax=Mytilus galloprovincialis TaxID=29158 RepID=A0A8B6ECA5_MYTGA|nr:Hypothetical predicted protein [Mytilus galloprovincialis]